jgi:hypothetical protein
VPRTWGYVFIAVAALIGVGALLLPVPETVDVPKMEEPAPETPRAVPATPTPRAARTPKPPPAPKPATPPAPPAVKTFPMQDTTKARQLIAPKPPG